MTKALPLTTNGSLATGNDHLPTIECGNRTEGDFEGF